MADVSNGRYILKIIESKVQSWRSQRGGHNSFFPLRRSFAPLRRFSVAFSGPPPPLRPSARRSSVRPSVRRSSVRVGGSSPLLRRVGGEGERKKNGKEEIILRCRRGGTRGHYRKSVEEPRCCASSARRRVKPGTKWKFKWTSKTNTPRAHYGTRSMTTRRRRNTFYIYICIFFLTVRPAAAVSSLGTATSEQYRKKPRTWATTTNYYQLSLRSYNVTQQTHYSVMVVHHSVRSFVFRRTKRTGLGRET